jgi:hypothetical protein
MYSLTIPNNMELLSDESMFSIEGGNFLQILGIAACIAAVAIVVVPLIVAPQVAIPALVGGAWRAPAALFVSGVFTYATA